MTDPGKAYVSKEEKKIPLDDPTGKWTDLTLLPEWAEEYYDVYTVRKHGKWVMLKALKPEYRDLPEYDEMIEQEFETRYNLAHPNIVMVNDFEIIPGLGKAIITDDVYGYSLRRLIDEKRLTPKIVHRLQTQLLDVMEYIEENHIVHNPITPDNIIFTEYNENLKLTNVGYSRQSRLSANDTAEDIRSYGEVVSEVLENLPTTIPHLRRVADKCRREDSGFRTVADVQLALERSDSTRIYYFLIAFIIIMLGLLFRLTLK